MISDSIPAFGGHASSRELGHVANNSNLETVIQNENLKVFVYGVPQKVDYYFLDQNSFLWNGGFKSTQRPNDFDYKIIDNKFIYLKFEDAKLNVYTDHFSKIPLFYSWDNETLTFASSLELLLLLKPNKLNSFDNNGLLFYYNFGFSNYQNHLIDDVQSVAGGQHLEYNFKSNQFKINTYYNIFNIEKYNSNSNSLEENVKAIDDELLKATKSSIHNFNKIGIALSGGVDSGYLAQKINECDRKFNAYTLGFENDYNEFERIDYLSKKLDFKANKIIINSNDIINNYMEVVNKSSFPVGFNNSILNIIYKQANADGIDLMFDGDGADRLFLGMNKYLQLEKILEIYGTAKGLKVKHLVVRFLKYVKHPSAAKLRFYFQKFNEGYPFYGERKLSNNINYVKEFETILNSLALPKELKEIGDSIDSWLFFSLFSVYYTPGFFFHTPYELQLKHNITSNPQFWSDKMVELALSIPVKQKLYKKTTKMVLREAAITKIDDGYWNLSKIGLQNSYQYIKQSKEGHEFINDNVEQIKSSDEYAFLKEVQPDQDIDAERLLPYFIWKKTMR